MKLDTVTKAHAMLSHS